MPPSPKELEPVDAAAILNAIWTKNALRREAGLPLWPVRETYDQELAQARWRAHRDAYYDLVRAEILADLRARHGQGFGGSPGGRWAIEALVTKALRGSFRAR